MWSPVISRDFPWPPVASRGLPWSPVTIFSLVDYLLLAARISFWPLRYCHPPTLSWVTRWHHLFIHIYIYIYIYIQNVG